MFPWNPPLTSGICPRVVSTASTGAICQDFSGTWKKPFGWSLLIVAGWWQEPKSDVTIYVCIYICTWSRVSCSRPPHPIWYGRLPPPTSTPPPHPQGGGIHRHMHIYTYTHTYIHTLYICTYTYYIRIQLTYIIHIYIYLYMYNLHIHVGSITILGGGPPNAGPYMYLYI